MPECLAMRCTDQATHRLADGDGAAVCDDHAGAFAEPIDDQPDPETRDAVLAELEDAGPAGMDAVILAAQIESTLAETADALDDLIADDQVEEAVDPSNGGRYRLAIEPAGVSHD